MRDTINVATISSRTWSRRSRRRRESAEAAARELWPHLLGTDRRTIFAQDDFSSSIAAATTASPRRGVTIYRDKRKLEQANKSSENRLPKGIVLNPLRSGRGVVVDVKPEMSTLKVTLSRDAMLTGDYVHYANRLPSTDDRLPS